MNLGNGFAAGLAQGQQFTRGIADAYRAGQQMNDAREIGRASCRERV